MQIILDYGQSLTSGKVRRASEKKKKKKKKKKKHWGRGPLNPTGAARRHNSF